MIALKQIGNHQIADVVLRGVGETKAGLWYNVRTSGGESHANGYASAEI